MLLQYDCDNEFNDFSLTGSKYLMYPSYSADNCLELHVCNLI